MKKRIQLLIAVLAGTLLLDSCSMANGLVQSGGRLVQSVGRSVGIGR
ncbi:MAG: hypothetical protein J0M04_12515 [Verrucomicrobia bacterium]|nr:hypothetical protein [Verrucomicrobiota bacterium]